MKQILELKNDMAELDRLQRFVEKLGNKYGLSKKCIIEINLALEEVFANIVAYGYEDCGDHLIKISVEFAVNDSMALRIEDRGKPFNPLQVAEPEPLDALEDRGIGGLGIHLVKNVMDDVSYDNRGQKNVLEMTKSIL
jgi:serine/threonine-protein kinase RsbW